MKASPKREPSGKNTVNGYPEATARLLWLSILREAVALPKRAQPSPAPPVNRLGDRFELIVPVEFFLAR